MIAGVGEYVIIFLWLNKFYPIFGILVLAYCFMENKLDILDAFVDYLNYITSV